MTNSKSNWNAASGRSFRRQFLLSALALLIAVSLITAFTEASASAKAGDRPFKGTMINNDTIVGFTIDNSTFPPKFIAVVEIEGEITATHIGKGTVAGTATIDVFPLFAYNGCSSLIEGTIDFTAANGDEINMVMTVNELCGDTGIFTGQYEVIGGSGRFESAEGLIDVSGAPVDGEPSVSSLTGTIVY
jgi:hypothetical protein